MVKRSIETETHRTTLLYVNKDILSKSEEIVLYGIKRCTA
jgi:hypothetical protein